MDALRKLDHIAYIRFASVYRAFTDIESLEGGVVAREGRVRRSMSEPAVAAANQRRRTRGTPASCTRVTLGRTSQASPA